MSAQPGKQTARTIHLQLAAILLLGVGSTAHAATPAPGSSANDLAPPRQLTEFIAANCTSCHDESTKAGGLSFERIAGLEIGRHPEVWETAVRKLAAREMPPKDAPRPTERDYNQIVTLLETNLDGSSRRNVQTGRTESFRRLTRTEYQNAIRELLGLQIDATLLLPPDEPSLGFDNITVTDLSPALVSRYVSAAQKISRLAVGSCSRSPQADTFRIRPDVTQDEHIEGLPLGTRGGTLVTCNLLQDGDYEIQVRLMRNRDEKVEGLNAPHELVVLLDQEQMASFDVKPPANGKSDESIDAELHARIKATAGPHKLGVAFVKKSAELLETVRQPLNVHFNSYRHPRLGPAVYEVSIMGPFDPKGPGETPSRRRIFTSKPENRDDEEACAKRDFLSLAHRAYGRPVDDADIKAPLQLYREARSEADFDAGIETGLSAILTNPQFLFRIERDPPNTPPHTAYQISDQELAKRLSFFLWSSIPDDELLQLAERGELHQPAIIEREVRRMLADGRSRSLVTNFAEQWLYLRNLDSISPDMRLFPDFDDNLRQAFRQESELYFQSIIREDRSVLDLLSSNFTFLNERLAKHYGIPHVYGSEFRRVAVDDASHRGGLLRQASILTVTSYATRTSPVLRGQWVLKNILGMPPPPPPPNVPALKDNVVSASLTVRERLKQHRADAACASCHERMDPIGFALENFDAIGRWRERDAGNPVDASGGLPDGSEFAGVDGLEKALLARPELFVRTLAEKLMIFALGRGIEFYDAPAIRKIVHDARDDRYPFSQLVVGIVESTPFQMRSTK